MNGILIIDKPAGITSHDVVSRVRRILHTKRVGHTGTLDPFATGVMVILVGQATRIAQFLDKDAKEYDAVVRFRYETDTGDRTGNKKHEGRGSRLDGGIDNPPNLDQLRSALDHFRGEIEQMPPMYSAKKIEGKKLYELARKGETVERKPINVRIHELSVSEPPGVAGGLVDGSDLFLMKVKCSAGTYVRTLAEDIGRKCGIGAHLAELRRTAAGKFTIDRSVTLEQLANLVDPTTALISMTDAVSHLAKFVVAADRINKTRNGLSTRVFETGFVEDEPIQMLCEKGELIAIGFFDAAENVMQPKVVLV